MATSLWNGVPISAPVSFRSNQDRWVVEKLNKSFDFETSSAQRWELSFGLIPQLGGEGVHRVIDAVTAGIGEQHTMIMPQFTDVEAFGRSLPDSPETGDIEVEIAGSAGDTTIRLEPANGSTTYRIAFGTFIKFANHDKVYVLRSTSETQAYTTIGTTSSDKTIFPALSEDVPVGTALEMWDDVILTHRISPTVLNGMTFQDGILSQINNLEIWEDV